MASLDRDRVDLNADRAHPASLECFLYISLLTWPILPHGFRLDDYAELKMESGRLILPLCKRYENPKDFVSLGSQEGIDLVLRLASDLIEFVREGLALVPLRDPGDQNPQRPVGRPFEVAHDALLVGRRLGQQETVDGEALVGMSDQPDCAAPNLSLEVQASGVPSVSLARIGLTSRIGSRHQHLNIWLVCWRRVTQIADVAENYQPVIGADRDPLGPPAILLGCRNCGRRQDRSLAPAVRA